MHSCWWLSWHTSSGKFCSGLFLFDEFLEVFGTAASGVNNQVREGLVAELQKVEWPTGNQVLQGTVVVIVACIIVGTYLYLNDEVWKNVVQKFLLK